MHVSKDVYDTHAPSVRGDGPMEQQRADALHSHETTHIRNHVCVCVRARVCMHGSKAVLVPACTLTDQAILGIHLDPHTRYYIDR